MNDEKMKIGDEVAFHWDDGRPDTVVVITHIGYDGFIDGMDAKGTLYASKNPQKWTKTGRHFPLVTQLLRQMRGEKLPSAQPEIIRCKDCKYNATSKKCLNPNSFFLVPADDDFCSRAERRTDG